MTQVNLHRGNLPDQREDGAAPHRISHRYIDVLHLGRDTAEDRRQQGLVRQHDGRPEPVAVSLSQQFGQELGLPYSGRDADDLDLRIGQSLRIRGEGLRKADGEVLHEERGLVERIADHVAPVVPAEPGQTGVLHLCKEFLLALVEGVQPDKNETLRVRECFLQDIRDEFDPDLLSQVAVHHPLISHSAGAEPLAETMVERTEEVPDLEEAAFDVLLAVFRADPVPEMVDKTADGFLLRRGQIGEFILDSFEIRHVGKQGVGIDEILVRVVEVGEQDIAPEDEFVQGLLQRRKVFIDLIELQQKGHLVGLGKMPGPVEKVIDGKHRRGKMRPGGSIRRHFSGEIFPEKSQRAPVREHEAAVPDLSGPVIMPCNLLKEGCHVGFSMRHRIIQIYL